ncbi:hypothetical protein GCM10009830_24330 [Glycomyces endophyticus]|uniref:LPXTG cell wall anchor domain-containing protein n=1 Tax=Glycomyces endophyticus TaxID=480996 RepID=A0ABN2GTZ4_9ACTN
MAQATTRTRRTARLAAAAAALIGAALAAPAPAQAQDGDPYHPFLHADLAFTGVAPGGAVEVNPRFTQEAALSPETAAIVIAFSGSFDDEGQTTAGARADADYDNCRPGYFDDPRGTTCIVTEFTDLPGAILTLTGPVVYTVDADAPALADACACAYGVSAVTAEDLATDFPGFTWDPESENLVGLTTADAWDGPGSGPNPDLGGDIAITTAGGPDEPTAEPTPEASGPASAAPKLPETGAPVGPVVSGAAALVALGMVFAAAAARRRPAGR